jgi:UDP:flavonoid glycosyltransferase YjiC (YdhE family)
MDLIRDRDCCDLKLGNRCRRKHQIAIKQKALRTCNASPVAFRVLLHHARPAPDHEPADGLLRDRNFERGAG